MTRERWNSPLGFWLSAIGSAVGIGNICRFPGVASQNGGGWFVLVYVVFVFVIGLPVLVAEFGVGKKACHGPGMAYRKLGNDKWRYFGFFQGIISALILSFYSVIGGYILLYIKYIPWFAGDFEKSRMLFEEISNSPIYSISALLLFLAICAGIALRGIQKGIERFNKFFMPVLAGIMILLIGWTLFLPGAIGGVKFLFHFSGGLTARNVFAALGQACFTLGIGAGVMIAYGSRMKPEFKKIHSGLIIGVADTLVAILAGLMVFPAIFAIYGAGYCGGGMSLVFEVLPVVFSKIPFGGILGCMFMVLLAIAAITSAISLLEVPASCVRNIFGWSRKKGIIVSALIIFIIGIPGALSFGIIGVIDFAASNIMLPLGILGGLAFLNVFWRKIGLTEKILMETGSKFLTNIWVVMVRFIIPAVIIYVLISNL
jgi:neurotransmitter:Na+ symporter, NSS family